jgi:hypothetical protein
MLYFSYSRRFMQALLATPGRSSLRAFFVVQFREIRR